MQSDDRTHYDLLGVTRDADSAAVRRAWKVLIQVWHPDRFTGEMRGEAERMTQRINESYNALRDDARRAAYDRILDARTPKSAARPFGNSSLREPRVAAFTGSATGFGTPAFAGAAGGTRAQAAPTGSVLLAGIEEIKAVCRRYPRPAAAFLAGFVLLMGFALVTSIANRPSLPSAERAAGVSATAVDTGPDPLIEAERENARERLMRQLALAQQREAIAGSELREPAPASSAAPIEPVPPVEDAAATAGEPSADGPTGGRIVRILPRETKAATAE